MIKIKVEEREVKAGRSSNALRIPRACRSIANTVTAMMLIVAPSVIAKAGSTQPVPTAQTGGPAAPAPADLVIAGETPGQVEVRAAKDQAVNVPIRNVSSRVLVVTHASLDTPSLMCAVPPLTLAPGEVRSVGFKIDGTKMMLPKQSVLYLAVQDSSTSSTYRLPLKFSSRDVFVFSPSFAAWRVGEAPAARTCKIINLPAGKVITGLSLSDNSFTATLKGDIVTITPISTAAPHTGSITLLTEPGMSNPPVLSLSVSTPPTSPAKPPSGAAVIIRPTL